MRHSRISIAKPDIVKVFEAQPSRIFKHKQIGKILVEHRASWRLTQSMTLGAFLTYLREHTPLRRIDLRLPYRPEVLYTWGAVSPYQIALAIKPSSYLTHYTAMALHELTVQVPKTIYVNVEQRPQHFQPAPLTQDRVDQAFRRPKQRMTSNIAELEDLRLAFINGKYTNQLGVVDLPLSSSEQVRVTGLERTLIDIAVRPGYAGGVGEVAAAYAAAKPKVSVNKLAALLSQLGYLYPYHQVIGYYLERAGYRDSLLVLFERQPIQLNFYLTYGMVKTDYSKRWKLFVPKGF